MATILLINGLIFTNAILTHGSNIMLLRNALIDTGSSSTVISIEIAHKLDLKPEADDLINSVQGVGGSESVYEKKIDSIKLDVSEASDFHIQVGAMDYGIALEAIIGLDLLKECHAALDLKNFVSTTE